MKQCLFFSWIIVLLFSQCKKSNDVNNNPVNIVVPEPISARLQGTVLDENGMPAQGVTVRLGASSSTTDDRGYFRFQNASLDKKSSMVSAEKTGYYKAFRTFAATSGTNQVIIKLIPKTLTGSIDAVAGGKVILSNGGKVVLPANGIVKAADNSPYTGSVSVYAAYIDPTASDFDQNVPGSLMANDANGTRVTLASYGMMAVLLESASGEKLQIKSGSVSTLTTPIPSTMLSSAPSTIPLWYVNEQTGIWEEEGSATRQGNVYVGNVSHYSFWNCDIPMQAIVLSMTILQTNGDPLVYGHVRITRSNPVQATYGITDSSGQVSGWVPANEALVLELVDQCGNAFFTQNIGPFSSNTNLGNITLTPATSASILTVTGRILGCTNNPVTDGYARIYYGYHTRYATTDANGNFSTTFSTCSSSPATVDILGIDNAGLQQSSLYTVPVATPVTVTGDVIACGTSAAQFINYVFDGVTVNISSNAPDTVFATTNGSGQVPMYLMITGSQMAGNNLISFIVGLTNPSPGTYPMASIRFNNIPQLTPDPGSTVTFTSVANVPGEFYSGTFNATIGGGANTITGSFRVRRL